MASTKGYRDYILEQLSEIPLVSCRPMMGEYLLYCNGLIFGGIYDDRLLVKIVPKNKKFNMKEVIPYKNARPLYYVEEVDNREKLVEIVTTTTEGLREQSAA